MFYLGLDLGKHRDFTALAVLERTPQELAVRYVERAALGTPYTRVVQRMGELTRHRGLNGHCYLAVDATGVGVPVVESLRAANLGCRALSAVTITGGERARQTAGFGVGVEHWTVPRTDLLSRVQMLLEKGELKIAKKMRESGALIRELISMRRRSEGESTVHDDLVLAVALACWQASRPQPGISGSQRLI